jgi:hypothetical protein
MAYGEMSSAVIRFATPSRVDLVVGALEALEFKYNVAMVLEAFGQNASSSLLPPMQLLRDSQDAGIFMANYALRNFLEDAARLQLASVTSGSSFDISLSGVAEALKALIAVVDPTSRLKAKEDARHEAEMHRIEEELAKLNLDSKRWEIAEAQFDRLVKRHMHYYDKELQTEIRRVYIRELARNIVALDPGKIEIVEPPTD